MNRLSTEKRAQILGALVEGNSIRATSRMTGAAKNTVIKLLGDVGLASLRYQDETLRDLPCKRIQVDEIWSFCYAKEANVPEEHGGELGYGDVWTWSGICADTRLVPTWLVGRRDAAYAIAFMTDLADRLRERIQLTTDGHRAYLTAVGEAFGYEIDYAMLVKLYGRNPDWETRYSPARFVRTRRMHVCGSPDLAQVSTSYAERQNLTMRMSMRRFTRLTNGFSKKFENLEHAVATHFMHYNFARVHSSIGTAPAVAAGVADHVWSLEEIVELTHDYSN